MERCPVCRAALAGNITCRRCGCELAGVAATEDAAEALLHTSVTALAEGEWDRAAHFAATSAGLHHTPLAVALIGFAEQWRFTRDNDSLTSPIEAEEEIEEEADDDEEQDFLPPEEDIAIEPKPSD
ncbi:hypothetical protein CCP3SC15_3360002 [Gammaproteobacteria bacterium]